MNNREYLNTLSDEEFYNALENLIDKCEWCPEYDDGKMTCRDDHCVRNGIAWLQEPHETTADEDFAEMGFRLMEMDIENGFAFYKNGIKQIEVGEEETYLNFTQEVYSDIHHFKLSEIDQIRTIADKKRKEMGWDK